MTFALLALFTSALTQSPNDAEKAFRAMEQALSSAETLEVTFESTWEGGQPCEVQSRWKGTVALAKGNKFAFAGEVEILSQRSTMTVVSDGTTLLVKGNRFGIPGIEPEKGALRTP
jgi:outer membrane lipoprotein-sorting protein